MEAESPLERNYVVRLHRYGKLIEHDCQLVNKLPKATKNNIISMWGNDPQGNWNRDIL